MSLVIQSTPANGPEGSGGLGPTPDRGVALPEGLTEAFVGHGAGADNVRRLVQDGALCVTTGHQPTLFTGPLLTISKAMAAIALARRLERDLGRSVVPVFWVAGDDHDFAECNHTYVLNRETEVARIELRERSPDDPATPMYREILGTDIDDALTQFAEALPDTEFHAAQMEMIGRHYRPDTDVATAFTELLAELLGEFGLVVFRPSGEAAKRTMRRYLISALEESARIDAALLSHTDALSRRGHATPVSIQPGNTLVMIEGSAGRDRLVRDDDTFVARRSQERWSLDELIAIANEQPSRLSPNVLLRPVVEAALLPTAGYVAGPTERAYVTQADPVYEILRVQPQDRLIRWSGRILERRIVKILEKYELDADDLLAPDGQLEARLVRGEMPAAARDALRAMRQTIGAEFPKLSRAAIDIDPTLRKPVDAARSGALKQIADVEKRLISHLKERDDILLRQLATVRNSIFPERQPQERVLNVFTFLAKYGPSLLEGIADQCRVWASDLETESVPA